MSDPMRAGRPDFIPAEVFRAFLTAAQANRWCAIDGIMCASYVARAARRGQPIASRIIAGGPRFRLIDVVARARAEAVSIARPATKEMELAVDQLRVEKRRLTEEIEHAKHFLSVQETSRRLTGATLLSEAEIVAGKLPLPDQCGVYFLIRDDRVVYVGQSISIANRISAHFTGKDFNGFAYIACDRKALDVLESLYIHTLRPEYNGRWASKAGMLAPLRLDELLGRRMLNQMKVA